SYQVGFVMLSQSIKLNVFSRIFYLLLIGIKHKYDRNILNNNILDEDENKIYINFGKKFIKATKNWYKCGYIKLWFETRKLKREIRNKEGE
ncbi:hypothetical protein OLQ17_04435, partial [Campylobacter jejuni]|nr:hypothetical protein [Campylobacter jejuni]